MPRAISVAGPDPVSMLLGVALAWFLPHPGQTEPC